ncbi:MAG: FAD-dependent oxidoreductase [Porticoccaceae bacterium]
MVERTTVDVAVIGGGIHGAGVAQAAAAAGYTVALFEKDRLAAGTSSKSSKLIHGGLRYLQQGEVSLVRESLRERDILLRVAPHLVHLNHFYIPVYADSHYRPWQLRLGLGLYGLLAGRNPLPAARPATLTELSGLPRLRDGLQALFRYEDAQTDDRQLTRAVALSARSLGARLFTGTSLVLGKRFAEGYELSLRRAEGFRTVRCRVVVNAAGPWINDVAASLGSETPSLPLELVRGSHLVIDQPLSPACFYLESPDDQRAVFALPWDGGTLLGTTEGPYQGDPGRVQATAEEEAYLLGTLGWYFPAFGRPGGVEVRERMAGLRVLPTGRDSLFRRSREVRFSEDLAAGGGYLGIYGGKLTGYRATADKVIKRLATVLGNRTRQADTRTLRLPAVTLNDDL